MIQKIEPAAAIRLLDAKKGTGCGRAGAGRVRRGHILAQSCCRWVR